MNNTFQNPNPKTSNTNTNLIVYVAILCVLAACLFLLYLCAVSPQRTTIGTINLTGLVDQFVKNQATQKISKDVLQERVKTFAKELEKAVKTIAQKHHAVILPAEAVIAGAKDYTTAVSLQINQALNTEQISEQNNTELDTSHDIKQTVTELLKKGDG
jgi:hypothetical protein